MIRERVLQLIDAEDDKMAAGILFGYCAAMSAYDAGFNKNVKLDVSTLPKIETIEVHGNDLHVKATWPEHDVYRPAITKVIVFSPDAVTRSMNRLRADLQVSSSAFELESSKTKNKKVDKSVAMTYLRIVHIETKLQALEFIAEPDDRYDQAGDAFWNSIQNLRVRLYCELTRAQQDLLMWGVVIGGEIQEFAAKTMMYKSLRKGYAIGHLMDRHGRYHGCVQDEDELRQDIVTLAKRLKLNPADFYDKWDEKAKAEAEED